MALLGWPVIIPTLEDNGQPPFCQQHVHSVVRQLANSAGPVALIAHSGGGPLLAAIAAGIGDRAMALMFVDAGLPEDGRSRLEMLRGEAGNTFADAFEQHLKNGGRYPEWSDGELAPIIENPFFRAKIIKWQRPRDLQFWEEAVSAPVGSEGLPCAYLQLSAGYGGPAGKARERGWPVIERASNHFAIVTDPAQVAEDLQALLGRLGISAQP